MLVEREIFDLKSTITDDWGGSHRVVINLEALSTAKYWKIGISLPDDYTIDRIYDAELTTEGSQTYLSGKEWNKNIDKGEKIEIVLIVTEGNSSDLDPISPQFFFADTVDNSESDIDSNSVKTNNSEGSNPNLNFESNVILDWDGGYKLELEIEANQDTKNWQANFELPYSIREVYGVDLIDRGNGTYTIKGQNGRANLQQGESIKSVLIIDDGMQPAVNLDFANTTNSASPQTKQPTVSEPEESKPKTKQPTGSQSNENDLIVASPSVTEDWSGGYKLEMKLEAQSNVRDWTVDFQLPYTIRETYGVDIIDRGNGNYTISGQNGLSTLQQGQSIKPVFIVEDNGQSAVLPESISVDSGVSVTENNNKGNQDNSNAGGSEDTQNTPQPDSQGKVISVDNDFGGNLENAIASANDGDVVELGSKTYYTDGITVDKDITIDGREGSIVNGSGTSGAVFKLTSGATGATIQDLEITNANIGIDGYKAFNLLLQNLNVNNIGINQTIRDGQNNSGILLGYANGLQLLNSTISNIGRKGVGIGDTDGALISGLTVRDVNLAAQHAQSHDAAGIKFFNTNDVVVRDNYFSDINAYHLWNDTTNATKIIGNTIEDAGDRFQAPDFNNNVDISGIYNEKSSNSVIKDNKATAVDGFAAFQATEFTTETMTLGENNFSNMELNTRDFWVNEAAEKLIATTEDPSEADYSLFADEYIAQANIG